jgi:hypothetical protein
MTAIMPRRDEVLIGLLCRVTRRNHMPRMRVLLAEGTPIWHARSNLVARDDVDFAQLAYACRLAPYEVEARRYRQIELTNHLPRTDFHGATSPLYDIDLGHRRIAPSWLTNEAYHSAFGRAVRAGQAPVPEDGTYDRADILNRASELISGSEVLIRRSRGEKGLPGPMKDPDKLAHVGHLGWPRRQVEAALSAEPLSFAAPRSGQPRQSRQAGLNQSRPHFPSSKIRTANPSGLSTDVSDAVASVRAPKA